MAGTITRPITTQELKQPFNMVLSRIEDASDKHRTVRIRNRGNWYQSKTTVISAQKTHKMRVEQVHRETQYDLVSVCWPASKVRKQKTN